MNPGVTAGPSGAVSAVVGDSRGGSRFHKG